MSIFGVVHDATADRTFAPVATGTVSHRHLRAIILLGLVAFLAASLIAMKRGTEVGAVIVRPGFGDSMIPTSCDGDTIVAWSGNFDIVRGGLYLIRHSGILLFKQFAGTKGDNLVFVSVNKQHEDNHFEVPRASVEAKAFAILPTHHLWEGEGAPQKTFPGFKYPTALDIRMLDTQNQIRVKTMKKRLLEITGGSATFYGRMAEPKPEPSGHGFFIELPPGDWHCFEFVCPPGANGSSPLVVHPESGRTTPNPFGGKGTIVKSGGKLSVECRMPFSLRDVFVVQKETS